MTSHLAKKIEEARTKTTAKTPQVDNRSWTLKECLAIIDDPSKPISYRAIRSWASGQVVLVPALSGKRRPKRYGRFGLICFLLTKRLLQEVGLSGRMAQTFIDKLDEGDFEGKNFAAMLNGHFLLVQNDGEDGTILFFDDPDKFGKAVMIFASSKDYAPRWTAISMPYLVQEMSERISAWDSRTEYKQTDRGAGMREAFRQIREENLAHGLPANFVPTRKD
jgi:hypothetical protein